MDEETFLRRMAQAEQAEESDYAIGYKQGLRNHGQDLIFDADHWNSMYPNRNQADLGRGYRDGFAGHPFRPTVTTRHTVWLTKEALDVLERMEGSLSAKVNVCITNYGSKS